MVKITYIGLQFILRRQSKTYVVVISNTIKSLAEGIQIVLISDKIRTDDVVNLQIWLIILWK